MRTLALVLPVTCVCAFVSFAAVAQNTEEAVVEAGKNGVSNPKCISCPAPSYTEVARRKKISGDVMLDVIVLPDGTAGDISVATSLEPSLDASAVETVKNQWRFEPAQKDGKPVKAHVKISVSFHIK